MGRPDVLTTFILPIHDYGISLYLFSLILFIIFWGGCGAAFVAYGSSRLGAQLELWLPAYATAIATQDLSSICDL